MSPSADLSDSGRVYTVREKSKTVFGEETCNVAAVRAPTIRLLLS